MSTEKNSHSEENERKNIEEALGVLSDAIKGAKGEIKDSLEKEIENIKYKIALVKPELNEKIHKFKKVAKENYEKSKVIAEEKLHTAKDEIDKEVKSHPWRYIGIVGLVCLILGIFLGKDNFCQRKD